MNAFTTIDEIIASYCNERGDYELANRKRYERIIMEGYADLNMNHVAYLSYYVGVVNEANILKLPEDLVDYLKIGLEINGKIWTLTRNDNIALSIPDVCGIEANDDYNLLANKYPIWHPNMPGGWNVAQYRVDKSPDYRRIVFDGNMMGQSVHLEYVGTGVKPSGKTYIPVQLSTTLKDYLNWVVTKRDPQAPMGRIEMARRDFINAKTQFLRTEFSMTGDEILDAFRSGYTHLKR